MTTPLHNAVQALRDGQKAIDKREDVSVMIEALQIAAATEAQIVQASAQVAILAELSTIAEHLERLANAAELQAAFAGNYHSVEAMLINNPRQTGI